MLRPLAEMAPEFIHPVTGKSLREHWREFDAVSQPLAREHLRLDGQGGT
jgi:7,8-dihydro-6-hydroxymethylpterin-pyrophosphokinase